MEAQRLHCRCRLGLSHRCRHSNSPLTYRRFLLRSRGRKSCLRSIRDFPVCPVYLNNLAWAALRHRSHSNWMSSVAVSSIYQRKYWALCNRPSLNHCPRRTHPRRIHWFQLDDSMDILTAEYLSSLRNLLWLSSSRRRIHTVVEAPMSNPETLRFSWRESSLWRLGTAMILQVHSKEQPTVSSSLWDIPLPPSYTMSSWWAHQIIWNSHEEDRAMDVEPVINISKLITSLRQFFKNLFWAQWSANLKAEGIRSQRIQMRQTSFDILFFSIKLR